MRNIKWILFPAAILTSSAVDAGDKRHHDAHSHDASEIEIIYIANELSIDIETSMSNITKFEYAPKTEAEKKTFKNVLSEWKDASKIVQISPADACKLKKVDVDFENSPDEDHDHHHHKESKKEVHADMEAEYEFVCTKKIKHLDFTALKKYKLGEVEVKYVSNNKPGKVILEGSNTKVVLP